MPIKTRVYENSHVRDYNSNLNADGTVTLRANNNTPDRLLKADGWQSSRGPNVANVLQPGEAVTHWKMTFETDENGEVVPGSDVEIEYSIDGGKTFRNFYDDTNLGEEGYTKYKASVDQGVNDRDDDSEVLGLVATSATNTDGTGFLLGKQPLSRGDEFITNDFSNRLSEFTVCFAEGTRIETLSGSVNIEDLKEGASVLTLSGVQQVRGILKTEFTAEQLAANKKIRPIVIRKGALGDGVPMRALKVSPQHRILVKTQYLKETFGEDEALIAASHLTSLPGVEVYKNNEGVAYFHLVFDKHEIVFAEGAETESFYPGEMAIKAMSSVARQELFTMFPELRTANVKDVMGVASFIPTPKQQKEIVKQMTKQ